MQHRAAALGGTAIAAAFISIGNVLGKLYYDALQSDGVLAAIIAGSAFAVVLLVCVVVATCRRRKRV